MSAIDQYEKEFEAFVVRLNREGATADETVAAIEAKMLTLPAENEIVADIQPVTLREIFRGVLYNWLWVEPESLKQRRMAGELNRFFSGTSL